MKKNVKLANRKRQPTIPEENERLNTQTQQMNKTRTKNTVKHVVFSVKDVVNFSMRKLGIESDLL